MGANFALSDVLNYGLLYLFGKTGTAYFVIPLILVCAAGYLLGSVNTSIIVSKRKYGRDLRESGSGNPGLTNMLRTYGKKAALFTLLGDVGKTALSCLIGALVLGQTGAFLGGIASAIGHMWPVWFNFKGGKGVLSLATVLLCCSPKVFLVCFTVFFIIVAFTKYISLGSVICALLAPIVLSRFIGMQNFIIIPMTVVCLIVVWKHRANLKRLREGSENKVHLGKNGQFLSKAILIPIALVLAAASVLSIVFTFRTEYAVTYKNDKMTEAYLRILFVREKQKTFSGADQTDDKDEEIMDAALLTAKKILVMREAAAADGRTITDETRQGAVTYFNDIPALPGARENDTAETYCHRIYGFDVSPNDVVRVIAAASFAEQYEKDVGEEKASSLMKAAAESVKVSEKVCASVIRKY